MRPARELRTAAAAVRRVLATNRVVLARVQERKLRLHAALDAQEARRALRRGGRLGYA